MKQAFAKYNPYLIIAILVSIGAFAYVMHQAQQPIPEPQAYIPTVAKELLDTSGWKTYRNDEYGVVLKYPNTFYDLGNHGFQDAPSLYNSFSTEKVENVWELSPGNVIMNIEIEPITEPLAVIESEIMERYRNFNTSTGSDGDYKQYRIIEYGGVVVDAEQEYGIIAYREINKDQFLKLSLYSFELHTRNRYKTVFNVMLERLHTSL